MSDQPQQASPPQHRLPPVVVQLGYGGLLPFVVLAFAAWWVPDAATARSVQAAQIAYAAVILSFLGAVHWGLALAANTREPLPYVWGITPSLLGWLAVLLPQAVGAPLASIALIICWLVDQRSTQHQAFAAHYMQLRRRLTLVAWAALVFGRLAPVG